MLVTDPFESRLNWWQDFSSAKLFGSVIVTALNRYLGYEAAAQVAHEALDSGQSIRSIVITRGYVERGEITEEQLDTALDVLGMTRPE